MILKDGIIYKIGDCVIIKINQIAKKRIKYNNLTKKHSIYQENFKSYGQNDKKRIVLEYLGNGNFRELISGVIITIDPKDERIAPYGISTNRYEEKYEKANNAPLDKALEYPLTITGSWELIDLEKLRELSEAKNPEILRKIPTFEKDLLRSTIHSKESKKILNETIKTLEKEAHETIKKDYSSLVSRAQESAEFENDNLDGMVSLANNILGHINSQQKNYKNKYLL